MYLYLLHVVSLSRSKMAAAAELLLAKYSLSSEERFQLLVTDVPVAKATQSPPAAPSQTGNHLVDKMEVGVDWKHTTSSWLNRNTKIRIFTLDADLTESDLVEEGSWLNKEVKPRELKAGLHCDGEGYVMRTTYYNHANPKYSNVKRIITEVQSFKNNTFEDTSYALIQYGFPHETRLSPKKVKGKLFIPESQTAKKRRLEKSEANLEITCDEGLAIIIDDDVAVDTHATGDEDLAVIDVDIAVDKHVTGLPNFDTTGLPHFVKDPWNNAKEILRKNGVKDHPFFKCKKLVVSLTSDKCHDVTWEHRKPRCDCDGFTTRNICAHVIAVAFHDQKLEQFLVNYQPVNIQQMATNQKNVQRAGQKPGYRPRKRVAQQRKTTGFEMPFLAEPDDQETFTIAFVKDTHAYKCYGCSGSIRKDGKSPPPPPPFDIFLTTRTFRHYREKAKDGKPGVLHIKTKKENVYYHPYLACTGKTRVEVADKFTIPEHVKFRLGISHTNLIWNEFGYIV